VRRRQLDHLAAPDEQHPDPAQVFEQLAGQAHRGGRHADRMRADLGEVRTSLATAKLRWNSLVERGAQCARASAARTASFIWPRI
jgi:hypothetical protein